MYWRTDLEKDTVSSLETARDFYVHIKTDSNYWKWFVIAQHSSLQGAFALALDNGNGVLIQTPKKTAAILDAHRNGGPMPELYMDKFQSLYNKIQIPENLRSGANPFSATAEHDKAIESINKLRNGFIHFNSLSWSIEIQLMTSSSLYCCDILDFVFTKCNSILWHDDSHSLRAVTALSDLTTMLRAA